MDAPTLAPPPPPPPTRSRVAARTPKQDETLARVKDARIHARRIVGDRTDEAMTQWHRDVALWLGAMEKRASETADVAELADIELALEKHVLSR